MGTFSDAKRDAKDFAVLVNEDTDVDTRYGGVKPSYIKKLNQLAAGFNLTPAFDFVDGFIIQTRNQAGKDASGNYWIYNGSLPFEVTAGAVPSEPDYKQVTFSDHDNLSNRNVIGAHDSDAISYADSTAPARGGVGATMSHLSDKGLTDIGAIRASKDSFSLSTQSSPLNSYAVGFSESSSLGADYNFSKLDGVGAMSTVPSVNHSWLSSATGAEWIGVNLPFAVIIGDSIAEGHPNLHGRLHQSYENPTFNSSILNQYGQPSYELSRRTRIHWYNHGIGGQTTTQILDRFDRDGLGDTVAVGDGRPSTTLPRKPMWIWVNAGINDVSALTDTDITKRNLLEMCAKARRRGVNIGFNTIGPVNSHDETQREMQDDINNFILTVLPNYGAYTFDFHSWFADPLDATKINPVYDADGVHPNKTGYTNYVARLLDNPELPIFFNGFYIETGVGESISANFRRPTVIEFEDGRGLQGEISLDSSVEFVTPDILPLVSSSIKVYIKDVQGGIDPTKNSGFSNITTMVGKKTQLTPTISEDKSFIYGAHIAKVGGVWQVIASNNNVGISSISATAAEVTINFDSQIRSPSAGMIGTSTPSVYSVVANGAFASSCRVKSFDLIDGTQRDMTTVADGLGFWVSAVKV